VTQGKRADPEGGAPSEQQAYEELQAYTLTHGDRAFIHQHVVDTWTAQHADEHTKPIGLTFALVGLYLHLEKGFSGRAVQRVHMLLARRKRDWPSFALPHERGAVTARQVMMATAGPDRDRAIEAWCSSVWAAFRDSHGAVAEMLKHHEIS
jgi:hypothetical protein